MNTAGLLVQNYIWQTSQSETGETWADITDTRVLFILIPLQNVRFTSSASIVFKFFIESNGYSWCEKCRRTANTGIHTHTHTTCEIFFSLCFFCVCCEWGWFISFSLLSPCTLSSIRREHCKMSHLYTTTANILCSWRIFFIHRHQAAPHRCRMKSEGRERSRKQLKILLYMHKLRDNL